MFSQVVAALKDSEKRHSMVKQLSENAIVIEDEHGQQYKVVPLKDINIPLEIVLSKGADWLRDITSVRLREDDIILLSYPKTGLHFIQAKARF